MKVQIEDRIYQVTWRNFSEKIIHTPDGPRRPAAAIPPEVQEARRTWRAYLALKPFVKVSTITTTCEIVELLPPNEATTEIQTFPVSTGHAFFSTSEIKPFNRIHAKALSLRRALPEGVPEPSRAAFWEAFKHLNRPREPRPAA